MSPSTTLFIVPPILTLSPWLWRFPRTSYNKLLNFSAIGLVRHAYPSPNCSPLLASFLTSALELAPGKYSCTASYRKFADFLTNLFVSSQTLNFLPIYAGGTSSSRLTTKFQCSVSLLGSTTSLVSAPMLVSPGLAASSTAAFPLGVSTFHRSRFSDHRLGRNVSPQGQRQIVVRGAAWPTDIGQNWQSKHWTRHQYWSLSRSFRSMWLARALVLCFPLRLRATLLTHTGPWKHCRRFFESMG